jgi:hypothetical protein
VRSCDRCRVAIDGRIRHPHLVFVSVDNRVLRDASLCADCRERVVSRLLPAFDDAMRIEQAGEVGV